MLLGKYLDLSRLRAQNFRYEGILSQEAQLLALDPSQPSTGAGPFYNLVRAGLEAFHRYGGDPHDGDTHRATLRMGHVENALQRAVAEQTVRYEAKMGAPGLDCYGCAFSGSLGDSLGSDGCIWRHGRSWKCEFAEFGSGSIGGAFDDCFSAGGSDPCGLWI